MRGGIGVLLCAALAIGCPSVETDPPITESANTIAIFAPDSANRCASVLPFPSDLSKDPTTGLLDLPLCPEDSADLLAFKTGLNTLNGFSINATMTVDFSAPIDSSTIDGSIVIINTATGAPHPIGQTLFVPSDNLLTIVPGAPFDEDTTYIVAIGNTLKDADGGTIISDQAFTLLKSETPLVDEFGYSVVGLDDASANGLEQLRLLWQDIFTAANAAGITKENLLVAWSFTTQSVTSSYAGLSALVAGGASITLENTIAAEDHPLLAGFGIPTYNICKIHSGRVTLKNLVTETGTFGVDATGAPIVNDVVADYIFYTPNADPNPPPDTTPERYLDCSGSNPDVDFTNTDHFKGVVIFGHTLSRCKNVSVTVANTLGQAGWAVLAIDGPRAGARSINSFGDQDLDTCPDQPGTPEIIALGDETPNPFGVRDRMRQWGLEIIQAAELVKTDVRAFAMASPAGTAVSPTVGVYGHSWGGMAAVLAGSVSTDIDVMAISGASGGMGAIFTPLLQAGIAENLIAAGMDPASPEFGPTLERETQTVAQIYTWALEPSDPLYYAQATSADLPVLAQVLEMPDDLPGAPLHFGDTQATLGAALAARGALSKTSTATVECTVAGGGTDSVCYDDEGADDGMGVVGAPLSPCDGDATAALLWTTALQAEFASYIGSGGLMAVPYASVFGGPLPACTP